MIDRNTSIKQCSNCAHNYCLSQDENEILCELTNVLFPFNHVCDSFIYSEKPMEDDEDDIFKFF